MKKLLSSITVLSLLTISVTQVTACTCSSTNNNPSVKIEQPTIYIDSDGNQQITNERDIFEVNVAEILQIGFYKDENNGQIRAVKMPVIVRKVPNTLPKEITSLAYMFYSASSFNQNLSGWDTSNITDMKNMFYSASSFNGDISGWNTQNVTDMTEMFQDASAFNQDLSKWNTSKVITMSNMFWDASAFNRDLSEWDTANVTDMYNMFYRASAFNQDLSGWNVAKVQDDRNFNTNSGLSSDKLPHWVS